MTSLLAAPATPKVFFELWEAIQDRDMAMLKRVMEAQPPSSFPLHPTLLSLAAKGGYAQAVDYLLAWMDPREDDSSALSEAVMSGHENVVKLLIPVSDVDAVWDDLVTMAAFTSNSESPLWTHLSLLEDHVSIAALRKGVRDAPPACLERSRERLKTLDLEERLKGSVSVPDEQDARRLRL